MGGSERALVPMTLTVTDPNVAPGDETFRVDHGVQTHPGTVGAGTWSVTFSADPSFVVGRPPATPVTTPAGTGTPIPEATTGTSTGAQAATPVVADPRTTG